MGGLTHTKKKKKNYTRAPTNDDHGAPNTVPRVFAENHLTPRFLERSANAGTRALSLGVAKGSHEGPCPGAAHFGAHDGHADRREDCHDDCVLVGGSHLFLGRSQGMVKGEGGRDDGRFHGTTVWTWGWKKKSDDPLATHTHFFFQTRHLWLSKRQDGFPLKKINLSISEKRRFGKKKFSLPKPAQTKVHIFQRKPSCLFESHKCHFLKIQVGRPIFFL